MKPEAQASGTDAGRRERARGAVLMLIGFSVGFAVCYLLMMPAKNSPSTVASSSAVSARVYSTPFLPLARRPEADTRLMSYEYRDDAFQPYFGRDGDEDFRRAIEKLNRTNGKVEFITNWGERISMRPPDVFFGEESRMLDGDAFRWNWQQQGSGSLHLLDQRPAREFMPSAQ